MTTATKRKFTQKELETMCKDFLKKAYGLELTVPVKINNRLSRSLGRFVYNAREELPVSIEFAGFYLENGTEEQIISTIKHECIHYALFVLGKPHRDGNPYFENELRKHGSCSTNTQRVKRTFMVNVYTCDCNVFHRRRKLRGNGMYHRCTICKSTLTYKGRTEKTVN